MVQAEQRKHEVLPDRGIRVENAYCVRIYGFHRQKSIFHAISCQKTATEFNRVTLVCW